MDVDRKSVFLDWDGRIVVMSIDRCKVYQTDSGATDANGRNVTDDTIDIIGEALKDSVNNDQNDFEVDENIWDFPANGELCIEFLVKVLQTNDPRTKQPDFVEAKKREVDGLRKRGTWTKVRASSMPPNVNVVGGRFILHA